MTYLSDHLCSRFLETNYNLGITFEIDFYLICWQFALQRPVLLWEHLCFHTSSWNLPLFLTSAFNHFRYIQALANIPLFYKDRWLLAELSLVISAGHPTVSTARMVLLSWFISEGENDLWWCSAMNIIPQTSISSGIYINHIFERRKVFFLW